MMNLKSLRGWVWLGLFLATMGLAMGGGFECESDDDDLFDKVINAQSAPLDAGQRA